MFNPRMETLVCITDFQKLINLFQLLPKPKTCTVQLGSGIRIPFICGNIPCWTESQLLAALKGIGIECGPAMVKVLEEQAQLLCLRCDRYDQSQESMTYIPYSALPRQPDTEVNSL